MGALFLSYARMPEKDQDKNKIMDKSYSKKFYIAPTFLSFFWDSPKRRRKEGGALEPKALG